MTLDHQQRHLSALRSGLSLLVAPIQFAVHLPSNMYFSVVENMQGRQTLLSETQSYRQENLLLKVKLQRLEALEKENERLRDLFQSTARAGDRVLIAKLLQIDPDPFSHRVVLDRGSQHGVYDGQPLIDSRGIIGQIVNTGPYTSVALLITDISHALPVQSNRSGVRGIAVGTGSFEQLELNHVTNTADFKVGDLLVTSGLGQKFPAGYPVGKIIDIQKNAGLPFAKVKVQPSAALDRAREVLLVWPGGELHAENSMPQTSSAVTSG